MELLYASEDGQFCGFTESGEIITLEHSQYDRELLEKTQDAFMELICEFIDIKTDFEQISNNFALAALRILFGRYSDVGEQIKNKFSFSDPYDSLGSKRNLIDEFV